MLPEIMLGYADISAAIFFGYEGAILDFFWHTITLVPGGTSCVVLKLKVLLGFTSVKIMVFKWDRHRILSVIYACDSNISHKSIKTFSSVE